MHSAFQYNQYLLKRQVLALTGKFRVFAPDGQLVLFSQQKMFKLKEDIRIFSDESMTQEVLNIQARQIIDFSAAYDVIDSTYQTKVGVLRRKGLRSMMRDEWEILDVNDQPLGILQEDSVGYALLRRLLLGSLLPQNYDLLMGGQQVADYKQRFRFIGYHLNVDFSFDAANQLDRRLGIAAAILLGTIEGKQSS
ncbi:MAG: hypothetical protein ISR58_18670 [Anaerolineales bacterium]|nr:hypothetical protein [Chloroflexota bacterium]MBL6983205.1 hypothetical protein [Anaerolineales bacterium]